MSTGVALAPLPEAATAVTVAVFEPYLIEVAVPFDTGTVDEAVAQAVAAAQASLITAIGQLVGNAPTVLDTLQEIDAAIANDPNFATTVMTALATKALKTTQVIGGGLAIGGGDLTVNRTITVPKASVDEGKAGTDDTKAVTSLVMAAAISAVFKTPGALASLLPTNQPAQPGVPWLDGNVVAIS